MRSAVIVIGGSPPPVELATRLPADVYVIAADSGYDHARVLGLAVDLLVGDLDSISPGGLAHAEDTGVEIERFPVAKDSTDTELALAAALERGHRHVVVVCGAGDRFDHALATVLVAASPGYAAARVELWSGTTWIGVVHDSIEIEMAQGETFSVLPLHGPASGVSIGGADFPLSDHVLAAGTSLGVSNVVSDSPVTVTVASGTVVVIRPHVLGGTP